MTSSPPCWWTKTKDLSLASFVLPPEVVHFSFVIGVPENWLKTSYIDRDVDGCLLENGSGLCTVRAQTAIKNIKQKCN